MLDLHGWITQQIDKAADAARDATEGSWYAEHPEGRWGDDPEARLIGGGKVLATFSNDYNGHLNADHAALHGPAAVLRRCEADRRVLARHRLTPDAYWADAAMCEGCGTYGDMDLAETENLNDCPELLDLAHAHGLTEEILASLDRPQKGERPPYPGKTGNTVVDSLASFLISLSARTQPVAPTPQEKALNILDPELKKIPGYIPVPKD